MCNVTCRHLYIFASWAFLT